MIQDSSPLLTTTEHSWSACWSRCRGRGSPCPTTFYERFAGLSGSELERTTTQGFKTATANGDYKLDYGSYKLLFSNFLLGKTIYGPGKYLFGVFDNRDSF